LLCATGLERKILGIVDDLGREIYIEVRPVKVAWGGFFNIDDRTNWLVLEPRKFSIGHEVLLAVSQ